MSRDVMQIPQKSVSFSDVSDRPQELPPRDLAVAVGVDGVEDGVGVGRAEAEREPERRVVVLHLERERREMLTVGQRRTTRRRGGVILLPAK